MKSRSESAVEGRRLERILRRDESALAKINRCAGREPGESRQSGGGSRGTTEREAGGFEPGNFVTEPQTTVEARGAGAKAGERGTGSGGAGSSGGDINI